MILGSILLMTVLLQVSLPAESQTLTFNVKSVPLNEVFAIIKSQTAVLFFYDAALLENAKPVTIELKNVTLEKALNEILKGQPLSWVLENKTVTIFKRPIAVSKKYKRRPRQVALQHP